MKLCLRDIRPSFLKYNSKTTAIPEIIPVVLICTAGIICAARIHLYLALLLHRDYFRRSDASPACSFAPQRLFPPAECISILLFCYTEIISTVRMHLYLPLLLHRDYFAPVGFISILLFCYTGMIPAGRIHLYLALLLHRDYFCRPDSSLSCSFVTQGLFFRRPDSSPACSFAPQGLFLPPGFIPSLLFCYTGIISAGRIHPYLPLLFHRDYFAPAGCISIFLFCSTGIISAARIHPQLALLFHRDYFCQPNASLIRAPVKYQRPNFYYTGNTRMASADTLCKKLLPDRQK